MESFCTEMAGDALLRHAIAVDLSADGLRIQRPVGGKTPRTLQLEFEIPEVDEVVWAVGEVCFDEVWRVPATTATPLSGVIRTSGIRIVSAAERHRRLLREYVMDTWHTSAAAAREDSDDDWFHFAACYRYG